MSDQWESIKQYELAQRRERAEKQRELAEKHLAASQEMLQQQALREQARREMEQRQAEVYQRLQASNAQLQHRKEADHQTILQQIAKEQAIADIRRGEALRLAAQKLKAVQAEQTKVWLGWDGREFASPREQVFWDAWKACGYWETLPLLCGKRSQQWHVGRFWFDFADPTSLSAVEVDGWRYHRDRVAFNRDRQKDRYLASLGGDVLRFSGDEILHSVESAVLAAYEFIQDRRSKVR